MGNITCLPSCTQALLWCSAYQVDNWVNDSYGIWQPDPLPANRIASLREGGSGCRMAGEGGRSVKGGGKGEHKGGGVGA